MSPNPSRLQFTFHRANGGVLVRLKGIIDDSLDAGALLNGLEGVVVFDLDAVTQVTSFGVREWMTALQKIRAQLFFVRVRPALVSQFNMVRGFGSPGKLVSMYLPYVCGGCSESFDHLLDLRTENDVVASGSPRELECPRCRASAQFDDIPDSYLSFAAKQPVPQTPPVFESLLAAETASEITSLRVEKEVAGGLTGLWLSGTLDGKDYFKRAADGLEGSLLMSLEGVTRVLPEGLERLCAFLLRVTVPVTLIDIPIQLAERLALTPEFADHELGVRSVSAEFVCPAHERALVSVSMAALKQGSAVVQCSRCQKPMIGSFTDATLAAVRLLPLAKSNAEEGALLQAHFTTQNSQPSLKTPTSGHLVPGAVVMGRYRFERLLGAGGMAEVFLARQSAIGGFERLVVIKRILPGLVRDESFVEMFLAEARMAARITHPNVVQIQDVGREGGEYFIVMEYVNGWDMAVVLRKAAMIGLQAPISVALSVTADLARALAAAHDVVDASGKAAPIIHRDVSPHNVLLGRDGSVKLTDFGIAKAADSLTVTPTSVVKGKTAYLAPEVVNTGLRLPLTPLVDLFALGIVFHQLLVGTNPFRRDNDASTLSAILYEQQPAVSTLRREIPAPVSALVTRLLAKDPAVRVQSAAELANELQHLAQQYRPATPEPSLAEWLNDLDLMSSNTNAVVVLPVGRDSIQTSTAAHTKT